MRSALSRNHSTTSPASQRVPRKSTSFLSLRKEKDKVKEVPAYANRDMAGSSNMPPPSSYIDTPATSTNYPGKAKARRNTISKDSPTIPSPTPSPTTPNEDVYAFPSFDSGEDLATPTPLNSTPGNYLRTRSRTGPSGKSNWDPVVNVPPLRFSGSSSTYR